MSVGRLAAGSGSVSVLVNCILARYRLAYYAYYAYEEIRELCYARRLGSLWEP